MITYPPPPIMICETCGTSARVWMEAVDSAVTNELPRKITYMGVCLNGQCNDFGNKAQVVLEQLYGTTVVPKEKVI